MYRLVENDYEKMFSRVARNAVLQVASNENASVYWKDRKRVADKMERTLKEDFLKLHIDIVGFALFRIDLPPSFEMAIVNTQVYKQEAATYVNLREVGVA